MISEATQGIVGLALMSIILIGFFVLVCIALTVISIVGLWKLFKKTGLKGWEAIIPFYNVYTLCKIVWGNGWLFLLELIPFGGLIFSIVTYIKLAKAYGKGGGFAFGLIFLSPFFLLALGCSKSAYYRGPSNEWKTGTIIASTVSGAVYTAIMIILFVLSASMLFSFLPKQVTIHGDQGLLPYEYEVTTNPLPDYTTPEEPTKPQGTTEGSNDIEGDDIVVLSNYEGNKIQMHLFINEYTWKSDSSASSVQDGVTVTLAYLSSNDTNIKSILDGYTSSQLETLNSLDFYKNVSTDGAISGDGWVLQQINYDYLLGEDTYPCYDIYKVEMINGSPVVIEINMNGYDANLSTRDTLNTVFDWYGIDFEFDIQ